MADEELLRIVAGKTGLGLKFISKEDKLSNLLSIISNWLDLELALKGGSALNRVYLKENGRFSEDLDIDIFGKISVDEKIKKIEQNIEDITDFDVQGPRMLHLTARFDAYYVNEFGDKDRVMLDFYLANKQPESVKPVERVLIHSRFIETSPSIFPCYSLEDLIAQKLVALAARKQGKDIYDLFYSLDLIYDKSLVLQALDLRLKLRGSKKDKNEFFKDLLEEQEQFIGISAQLGNSINHYIPRKQRPNWKIFIPTLFNKIERLF